MSQMTHEHWMRRALSLAILGRGRTSPNPLVGAVIVQDGHVIGEGYHQAYGGPHAEQEALATCTEHPQGATMYVTLEPCCHHGKTPPCTEAILAAGITQVIIGSSDPNPRVAGGGVAALQAAGVTVVTGVLQAECDRINRVFFHYIQSPTPYVVLKYAMTADGKIATRTGASRWITGPAAREHVHETRHALSAILVGVGTVLADDPLLTCRLPRGRDPVRVVCDSRLSTPLDSRIVTTAKDVPTILATGGQSDADTAPYRAAGCKILHLPGPDGRVDLTALLHALHRQGIDSILVEGGAAIHYSMLEAGLAKRLQVYLAPKLFGGIAAKGPVGGEGVALPSEGFRLGPPELTTLGEDLLLEYDILGGGP